MKLKRGDKVIIEAGKDRGKTGLVKKVFKETGKIVVEGVNVLKKHVKATKEKAGGIVEIESPINVSNVMVLCPGCGKKTRVSYKIEGKNKERICKKCNQSLDKEVKEKK